MPPSTIRCVFVVREKPAGRAGMASYLNIRPRDGVLEVGHVWFAPALQRTRTATEALYLLIRETFDELGYRRLEWKCDALNAPSRAAALRLGFRFEGIFYRHMIVKDRNRDTAWYSDPRRGVAAAASRFRSLARRR